MKYSCDVIQDLLPLYYDKVSSRDSQKAVGEHLSECASAGIYSKKCTRKSICQVLFGLISLLLLTCFFMY